MITKCLICNQEYIKRVIGQNTCCKMCEDIYSLRKKQAYDNRYVNKDKLPMTKRCVICSKVFIAQNEIYITCSEECAKQNESKRTKGKELKQCLEIM